MLEDVVGLWVTDPVSYQRYRDEMTPILRRCGGGFRYDFDVSRTRISETDAPINRVFMIYFPDAETKAAFFADRRYQAIKAEYFTPAVSHVTILASYTR